MKREGPAAHDPTVGFGAGGSWRIISLNRRLERLPNPALSRRATAPPLNVTFRSKRTRETRAAILARLWLLTSTHAPPSAAWNPGGKGDALHGRNLGHDRKGRHHR